MRRVLKPSQWKAIRDLRAEDQPPTPAQPKAPTPNHLIAVTAQGTRLVSTR
jgi:hypothetical protein